MGRFELLFGPLRKPTRPETDEPAVVQGPQLNDKQQWEQHWKFYEDTIAMMKELAGFGPGSPPGHKEDDHDDAEVDAEADAKADHDAQTEDSSLYALSDEILEKLRTLQASLEPAISGMRDVLPRLLAKSEFLETELLADNKRCKELEYYLPQKERREAMRQELEDRSIEATEYYKKCQSQLEGVPETIQYWYSRIIEYEDMLCESCDEAEYEGTD